MAPVIRNTQGDNACEKRLLAVDECISEDISGNLPITSSSDTIQNMFLHRMIVLAKDFIDIFCFFTVNGMPT